MSKNNPLQILVLISLIALSACGREPDIGYDPGNTAGAIPTEPEPSQTPGPSPIPARPTATPWPFEPESLAIRLDTYLENPDGSLDFWIHVLNPNPGQVADCLVSVILYDGESNQLLENQESCHSLEAYAEGWLIVEFDESFIPDNYQSYNIFARAVAPGAKLIEGQLADLPVTGQEGVDLSQGRILPTFTVELDWGQPPEGYQPGGELEAQMKARLVDGWLDECLFCLRVIEDRQYAGEQPGEEILAESCQTISWDPSSENPQYLDLPFRPSGYTWIQITDPEGDYIPLGISAKAEVLLHGITLAESENELYLAPLEVADAGWSEDGLEVDAVEAETPYLVELKLRSLADDPLAHSIQLSIRYTEHDPEEWLVSGLLLFIPCLFGFCEDEAVVYTQEDQVTLQEGAEYLYAIPIQLPSGPTGEAGIGGYYYLALALDGTTVWRGARVPLEIED